MNKSFNTRRYHDDFPLNEVENIRIEIVSSLLPETGTILDLGCGDGFIMELLKQQGYDVEGIEIAEHAITKARKKGFHVYDFSLTEPWAHKLTKKYDVVFAGEIIEHVFDTDLFLQEIKNALKPNGRLIITTPNIASLARRIMLVLGISPHIEVTARDYDAGHVRYFTRSTLKKLLEENGFRVNSMQSGVVNFSNDGKWYSRKWAQLIPAIGNNIIVHAELN